MTQKQEFIEIVKTTDSEFPRTIWEDHKIDSCFGKRTLNEILESKQTHYLCCVERNYLMAYKAHLNNIKTKLFMIKIFRPFQKPKIGTAVEVLLDNTPYSFVAAITGSKLLNEIYPYESCHKEVWAVSNPFSRDKNWFEMFNINTEEKLKSFMPEFDKKQYLDYVKSQNNEKKLKKTLSIINKNKHLYPDKYI